MPERPDGLDDFDRRAWHVESMVAAMRRSLGVAFSEEEQALCAAVAAEREACAKLAEEMEYEPHLGQDDAEQRGYERAREEIAQKIRERK
jgi:hypothetical protein